MTIDWLLVGFSLGLITAACVCLAVGEKYRHWRKERNK